MKKIMNTSTINNMKKIINFISSICIAGSILNCSAYGSIDKNLNDGKEGKYGYSIITSEPKQKDDFDKNNWIRSRQRKVPCGPPNVVGIQSTSSATLIASSPQPIPDYRSCQNGVLKLAKL